MFHSQNIQVFVFLKSTEKRALKKGFGMSYINWKRIMTMATLRSG